MPVSADLENGFGGAPEGVAETVRLGGIVAIRSNPRRPLLVYASLSLLFCAPLACSRLARHRCCSGPAGSPRASP